MATRRTPPTVPAPLPPSRQRHAAQLLKAAGLQPTRMRVQVIATTLEQRNPILPPAVYQALCAAFSLSSIYRAMAEMHRLGLLERHRLSNGKLAYSRKRSGGPLQATCPECGRSADLENAELRQACALLGFADASLRISALCGSCARIAQTRSARRRTPRRLNWPPPPRAGKSDATIKHDHA